MKRVVLMSDVADARQPKSSVVTFADQDVRVKSHLRKGRLVKGFTQKREKGKESNRLMNTVKAASFAAVAMGVPVTGYLVLRSRYRAGFQKSAQMAIERAKQIQVGSVKAKQKNIGFYVGGTVYKEAQEAITGEHLLKVVKQRFSKVPRGEDFKSVPINNSEYNLIAKKPLPKDGYGLEYAVDTARIYHEVLKKGRNPTAVELAAQVIAYGDKFPDRQLIMFGHSSGGMTVHEAQEIIRRARPQFENRLKSIAIGTEWYGTTEKFGKSITLGSPKDPFTSMMPTRDLRSFKGVNSHNLKDYADDPEVQRFVKRFIYDEID